MKHLFVLRFGTELTPGAYSYLEKLGECRPVAVEPMTCVLIIDHDTFLGRPVDTKIIMRMLDENMACLEEKDMRTLSSCIDVVEYVESQ